MEYPALDLPVKTLLLGSKNPVRKKQIRVFGVTHLHPLWNQIPKAGIQRIPGYLCFSPYFLSPNKYFPSEFLSPRVFRWYLDGW